MYDDLNSLSRQLKMDNFSFLEIEETTASGSGQLLSDIAPRSDTPISDKKDNQLKTIEKAPSQDNLTSANEFKNFINYNNNHYYNEINGSTSHTEQAIILSVLFSSISKK